MRLAFVYPSGSWCAAKVFRAPRVFADNKYSESSESFGTAALFLCVILSLRVCWYCVFPRNVSFNFMNAIFLSCMRRHSRQTKLIKTRAARFPACSLRHHVALPSHRHQENGDLSTDAPCGCQRASFLSTKVPTVHAAQLSATCRLMKNESFSLDPINLLAARLYQNPMKNYPFPGGWVDGKA